MSAYSYMMILLFPTFLWGQNIEISGKVTQEDNKVLQYVNIYIENTSLGTVSNTEGKYNLIIPKEYEKNRIIFSEIGFKTYTTDASGLLHNSNIVLHKDIQTLGTVSVTEKKPNPLEILNKSIENDQENKCFTPYYLKLYTRDFIMEDTTVGYFRKIISETITSHGMLLWNKPGNILADKLFYNGKIFSEIHKKIPFAIRLNKHRISYSEYNNNNRINRNYNNIVTIDTVFFLKNEKIYIIDSYDKRIDDSTLHYIYKILQKAPSPTLLALDSSLLKIKENLKSLNIYFTRYFIDANNNYNIYKKIKIQTYKSGIFLDKYKIFNYSATEFTNSKNNSYTKYNISLTIKKKRGKNKKIYEYKSISETYCFNENFDKKELDTLTSEVSLSRLFIRTDYPYKGEYSTPIIRNNWSENIIPYLKPDRIEFKAIKEIKK